MSPYAHDLIQYSEHPHFIYYSLFYRWEKYDLREDESFLRTHTWYDEKLDINQGLLEAESYIVIYDTVSFPPQTFPTGDVPNHSHTGELPLENY